MKIVLLLLISFAAFGGASVIPDKDANGKIITTSDSFSAKSSYNFRGTGNSCALAANTVTNCEMVVTFAHVKFVGMAMINTGLGDKANLKILDTSTGTYSTVNNAVLNQFGFNWNMYKDFTKELMAYPADLFVGMRIFMEYTNGGAAKTIYINYYMHEE